VTTLGAEPDDVGQGFCALLDDGTVACWGANGAGQLGRGADASTVDSAEPKRVVGLSHVVSLDHTCAVDDGGAVWCWGTGPFLRAGADAVTTERAPVKLDLPAATRVGVGYASACAVVSDGVLCWGANDDAQRGTAPVSADGSADGGLTNMVPLAAGAPVHALAVGKATFALREDGALVTWGANPPIGRLSPIFPDPNPKMVDLAGVVSADLAYDDACATAGGTGYCWGASLPGSTSSIDRALPEPVVTPEPIVQIATTRTFVIKDVGLQRSRWCAVSISGSVYCWGLNDSGQAGNGTLAYAFDAVAVGGLPERVAQVRTTPDTTCALLTNGKIHCWGSNYNGQLGNGEYRGRALAPVEVVLP
jgi:alpha-tubulin suppressor-like RCC1 family protein